MHGSLSEPEMTAWGPEPVFWTSIGQVDADGQSASVGEVAEPVVALLHEPRTQVEIVWPDGSNHWGDRVQVTVTTPYRPVASFLFGGITWDLNATCSTVIEH